MLIQRSSFLRVSIIVAENSWFPHSVAFLLDYNILTSLLTTWLRVLKRPALSGLLFTSVAFSLLFLITQVEKRIFRLAFSLPSKLCQTLSLLYRHHTFIRLFKSACPLNPKIITYYLISEPLCGTLFSNKHSSLKRAQNCQPLLPSSWYQVLHFQR